MPPRYTPPVRRVAAGRGHVYKDANGNRVPGVTTILSKGIPKEALINWAANATADYAINNWDELTKLKPAARLSKLQKARYEDRDTAANRGTQLHLLAEQLVSGKEVNVPDELAGHVESYVQFLDDWDPNPVLVETTVVSHKHGYAGTLDLAAEFDEEHTRLIAEQLLMPELLELGRPMLALMDAKTSRSGIFGETALQLCAYRYADTYVSDNGDEQPMPEFDVVMGIHVRADGYDLRPIVAGPKQHREFLYAREVGYFADETSKTYIGEPLTPARAMKRRRLEVVKEAS